MTEDKPIACSLGTSALEQRLAAIADIGADSLVSRETRGDQHLLRFRSSDEIRRRLEGIVAAEAECCSFLDLSLTEKDGELALSIAAPAAGQAIADELAATFATDLGR
ncbi:MAG TPA: hypothetical protein VNO20_09270 [Solirubrobacterales bacterium]|nr:hypothetical protein [Solirubrobacterales bacterium]